MENKSFKFLVSGIRCSINKNLLKTGPPSKLKKMLMESGNEKYKPEVVIERPYDAFASILTMYQTGDLHMPMMSCPQGFLKELEFWEIKPEMLSSCCFYKLKAFLDEQETLRDFQESILYKNTADDTGSIHEEKPRPLQCLRNARRKVWAVLDFSGIEKNRRSILSKLYFGLCLLMILLSIFTQAYSTHPWFLRRMTNCERLEFMQASNMEDIPMVEKLLNDRCDEFTIPDPGKDLDFEFDSDYETPFVMPPLFAPGKPPMPNNVTPLVDPFDKNNTKLAPLQEKILPPPIQTTTPQPSQTTVDFINEEAVSSADDEIDGRNEFGFIEFDDNELAESGIIKHKKRPKRVKIPNMRIPNYAIHATDSVTFVFFTLDFLLRIMSCPNVVRYFMSVINALDAFALLGSYFDKILTLVHKEEVYKVNWFKLMKYLLVLRSLRLFRVVRHIKASRVLVYSIKYNAKDLFIIFLFLTVGVSIFSSLMFLSEERNVIESIPDGWYWAVVTMTTVGYGDVSPETGVGRLLACLCALTGVLLFSFTVPMFGNHFLTLYRYAGVDKRSVNKRYDMSCKKKKMAPVEMTQTTTFSVTEKNVNVGDRRDSNVKDDVLY